MKVGFIGTHKGMTDFQKEALVEMLHHLKATEFCHGDSIGADAQANQIAIDYGIKVFTIFPSTLAKTRAWCFNPAHERNYDLGWRHADPGIKVRWFPLDNATNRSRHLVDNVEFLLAAPKEYEHTLRSGTWGVVRYAWKVKRSLSVIPPVEREDDESKNDLTGD